MSSSDPSDHGRFLPGTMLGGRYRVVGLLGRGGMGEVYRADDLKLGQAVALKFLPAVVEKDASLVSCDRREAWEGTYPDQPEIPIHVEAGAYRGKPVYFRIVPPWAETGRTAPVQVRGQFILGIFVTVILVLMTAVGAYLVRRNLRLGGGDGRGAFQFARAMFAVELLVRTLPGHHVLALSEITKLMEAIAWCLLNAAMVWMLYLALEPYVRRLWPECLITWSRLVAGRFRDPLVGRDVLLGGAARAALLPLSILQWAPHRWLGLAPAAPIQAPLRLLRGLGFGLSDLLNGALSAFFVPLGLLFFLLLLRIVLRRQWLAVTVILGVFAVLNGAQSEYPWIDGPLVGLVVGVFLFVLLRLGLVALISAALLDISTLAVPLTTDFSVWYAWPSLLLLGLVFALYAYAFYISLAGRPIFRGSILPE